MEGHESIVRLLLQYGANTEVVDLYHRSPLKLAVVKNNIPIVKLLLHFGANTEQRFPGEETAFITACRLHRYECMDVLIAYGACIDAETMDTLSALKIAVQTDSMYTVKYLLHRGASFSFPISCVGERNMTILEKCNPLFSCTKSLQMQEYLEKHTLPCML